jgi:hypothetical protein
VGTRDLMLKLLALCAPFELFDDSRPSPGFAPGADYDANTATEVLVKKRNAFVEIYIPFVFTANRHFFRADGIGWAGIRADLATVAEIINMVIGLIRRWDQGYVREYGCKPE